MGKVLKSFGSLFRSALGIGSAPKSTKAVAPAPVAVEPVKEDIAATKKKTRARRVNLFRTEGGASGQELDPNQISQRQTLLGN